MMNVMLNKNILKCVRHLKYYKPVYRLLSNMAPVPLNVNNSTAIPDAPSISIDSTQARTNLTIAHGPMDDGVAIHI